MAIHPRMVMMILAFMCQCACTQGVSFQNCGNDREKVAELNLDDRNLNKTFTCVGIRNNAPVQWYLEPLRKQGSTSQSAGFCPPFDGTVRNCNTSSSNLHGYVFPERTSRTESTMTIRVQPLRRMLENATLVCQDGRETRCPLDLIKRPEEPSIIRCQPEGMVPENQTLTCQCQTNSLGKPPGVLKLSRNKYESSGFVVLKEGEQGQSNLPYSATLTRHNHTTRLRCGVQWGKEFIKSSQGVKQVTVGYPASQVVLNINSGNPAVAEKSDATFKCWATDGRPLPTLTLRGRRLGAEQITSQANLTYNWPDVRCEDSGNYTCTASNGMGPDKTATSWLNVTCGPRGFSGQIPPFLYQGEEIQFTFDLVANPTPFKVTFLFLGSLETNSTSKVKDIVLSGSCEKKGKTLVHASCTITLSNVTSSEAAGLYRGSLTNGQGSLDFNFEVKLNATTGEESSSDGVLVAAAVGGIVAAIVVILVIVIIVRRRSRKGSNETVALKDDGDHVYGNINVLNQMDSGVQNNAAVSLAPESADAGREVNADGLLYVSVDFGSNNQASTFPPPPPPAQDNVLYSAVDFNRTAPAQ